MKIDSSEVRALVQDLDTASARLGRRAASVMRAGSKELTKRMRDLAPVETGELRSSVRADVSGDGRTSDLTIEAGPTARQGFFQERGTSRHPAQPFAGPALDQIAPGVIAKLADAAQESALS